MEQKKFKYVYFILLPLLIAGYMINNFSDMFRNPKMVNLSQTIPTDYFSLFNLKDSTDFNTVFNYSVSNRPSISLLDYRKKYTIIIVKVEDSLHMPLTKFVSIKDAYSDQNTEGIYSKINENHFEYYFRNDTTFKAQNIEFNLSGDSITKLMESDLLICYYLKFNQISWKFNPSNSLDAYIVPKDRTIIAKKIPASIAIARKNNSVYFIILSVNDYSSFFDQKILLNLLTKTDLK